MIMHQETRSVKYIVPDTSIIYGANRTVNTGPVQQKDSRGQRWATVPQTAPGYDNWHEKQLEKGKRQLEERRRQEDERRAAEETAKARLEQEQARKSEVAERQKRATEEARAIRSQRAKEQLEKLHDPEDVIAQVLNYTSFGTDAPPNAETFWYKELSCVYKRKAPKKNFIETMAPLAAMDRGTALPPDLDEIDFNKIDPRNIEFEDQSFLDGKGLLHVYTSVKYEGRTLLGPGVLDIISDKGRRDAGRLRRGWELIFSDYCRGITKRF